MPAVGKITLDTSNYDRGLQRVSQGMSKTGSVISGAASAAGEQVGALGKSFGVLGNAISSVASGPIGMLMAAFGALVYVGTQVWDRLTLSAEEYAAKVERAASAQNAAISRLKAEQSRDDGYMKRLRELSKEEKLNADQKREAQALIAHLREQYGDLGVSIDMINGKLTVDSTAEGRLLTNQGIALRDMLSKSYAMQAERSAMLVKDLGGDGAFKTMNLTDQIKWARGQFSAQTTQSGMDKWGKLIDSLEKQRDIRAQINDPAGALEILRRNSEASKSGAAAKPADTPVVDKFAQALGKDAAKLLGEAMTANGMGKQAAREELFRRYEEQKGSALTIEEAGKLGQLADLQWRIKEASTSSGTPRIADQAVRTNALTARGGFSSAIRTTDRPVENINHNTKQIVDILRDARALMAQLGRAE